MRKALVVLALAALTACASTEMARYVGRPIEEVQFAYGPPINVVAMQDGRSGFQYRWGGGTAVIPGTATATTIAGVTTVNSMPATVLHSEGCVITFIAADRGNGLVVEETRPPNALAC